MITLVVEKGEIIERKEVRNIEVLEKYIKEAFLVMEDTEHFLVYLDLPGFGRLQLV